MARAISLKVPLSKDDIDGLKVGDVVLISGKILAGRDAVLPKVCEIVQSGCQGELSGHLSGGVIFHTAVSPAGVGPTSSNKLEIESSFEMLSKAGIRMHLGKGSISKKSVMILKDNNACFAVTPPVSALLGSKTLSSRVLAFGELGMEALYELSVDDFPAIIAVAHGDSLFNGDHDE